MSHKIYILIFFPLKVTDPKNNTKKYLAIGSPSQESQLPL